MIRRLERALKERRLKTLDKPLADPFKLSIKMLLHDILGTIAA